MPDTAEYLARIQSYANAENFLQQQQQAPGVLRELTSGVPESELRRSPAPGKWSVVEIMAHMAEDELVNSWRYRQMLERNDCKLSGFDQDTWAKLGKYSEWPPEDALRLFELLRQANLRMLKDLSDDEWERHGIHAERGKITVRDLARHMAGHDRNHIEQIRRILGR